MHRRGDVRGSSWLTAGVCAVALLVASACTGADDEDSPPPPTPDARGWNELSAPPIQAPVLRAGQAAVWTGRQALLWGGSTPLPAGCVMTVTADGAAWSPRGGAEDEGTWTAMAPAPLAARSDARLWWTGRQAVLVGGTDPKAACQGRPAGLLDAAAFTPGTGTDGGSWKGLPALPWPVGTSVVASTWAGPDVPDSTAARLATEPRAGQVLVWSPSVGGWSLRLGDASWTPLPPSPLPASVGQPPEGFSSAYSWVSSVWTGREWLLLGTATGAAGTVDVGLAFDPTTSSWRQLDPGPARVVGTGVVWAGDRVLAFDAGHGVSSYDVDADRWTAGAPDPLQAGGSGVRDAPALAWTGRELLVWGGGRTRDTFLCIDSTDESALAYGGSCNPATGPLGAAYDPASDTWRTISDGPWQRRASSAAVWTGSALLLAGGEDLEERRAGGVPRPPDRAGHAVATFTPG